LVELAEDEDGLDVVVADNSAAREGAKAHASETLAATAKARTLFFTAPKPLPKVCGLRCRLWRLR
jgi:hypothetical protein